MANEEKLKVILLKDIEAMMGKDSLKNDILNEVHRGKLPVYETDKVSEIEDEENENE